MPTGFRALGTIDHWIRPYGTVGFLHLGTAVTSPSIREGDAFLPLFNDIGGRSVPTELIFDRRKGMAVTTLNNINWTTYDTLRVMSPIGLGIGTYFERPVDHGMPILNSYSFDLLFTFTFGPAFSPADTPNGRLYYGCVLKDWEENSQGSRAVDLTLTFEMYGTVDWSSRTFARYTEDPTAWGTVTINQP